MNYQARISVDIVVAQARDITHVIVFENQRKKSVLIWGFIRNFRNKGTYPTAIFDEITGNAVIAATAIDVGGIVQKNRGGYDVPRYMRTI